MKRFFSSVVSCRLRALMFHLKNTMSICPRCATQFTCAMADQTGQACWCTALPVEPVLPIYPELASAEHPSCFCPVCLQEWKKVTSPPKENS